MSSRTKVTPVLGILPSLTASVLLACSGTTNIGENLDGSVDRDSSVVFVRTDECGNGLDDDGNGRVDDGCPCGPGETQACFAGPIASQRVGACTDGVQTCAGSTEWGDWGDAPCVGGIAPAAEQCDGMDHDCNGAVDDGCPCTTGMTRACGVSFSIAPCHAGTQTCEAGGTWSGCLDAVGPTPDLCGASGAGDGLDQDCDGTTDEGCGCVPEPEICGDGVDNDCDGVIDERACRERPDAGTVDGGTRDGGACVPTTEVCDGLDNDCDGSIDEGACDACRCDYWATALASSTVPLPQFDSYSPRTRSFEVAYDGDGVLAFLSGGRSCYGPGPIMFAMRRPDGSTIGTDRVLSPDAPQTPIQVAWSGSRWYVAWEELTAERSGFCLVGSVGTVVLGLAADGTTVAGPVRMPGIRATAIAAVGDEVYVVRNDGVAGGVVQRFDTALSAVGSPIALPLTKEPYDLRVVGDAVAITGIGEPWTTSYMALVRHGALVREVELQRTSPRRDAGANLPVFIADDADGSLVPCWTWAGGVSCRYFSPVDASPLGPAFNASLEPTLSWDIVRASCSMALMTGLQHNTGSGGRFLMSHFDASGTVDTRTIDRQWVQPRRTMRLFAGRDGRLLRVFDSSLPIRSDGLLDVTISTLRCREAPPPVTDCTALQRTACGFACDNTLCSGSGSGSECFFESGGSGHGFPASSCMSRIAERVDCSIIDAPRCQERLAEPPQCVAGGGAWAIPADCVMPR